MVWWFARCQWSHPNFADLAAWALNEPGAVHTSQLSHIRNQKMRMIGLKTLDGFGAVNLGLWAYHNDRKLLRNLGAATLTPHLEALLERGEPIIHPHQPGRPIDSGDWMMIYLGYLEIPGVNPLLASDTTMQRMAFSFRAVLDRVMADFDGVTFTAIRESAATYLVEAASARRLLLVLSDLDTYEPLELQRDLEPICDLLSALAKRTIDVADLVDRLPPDHLTVTELGQTYMDERKDQNGKRFAPLR